MKNPKKNQKTPFTRRQFVGSCTAGASMIGLAPYFALTSCDNKDLQPFNFLSECEKINFNTHYNKGEIRISLTFPTPHEVKKKLKIKKNGNEKEADFKLFKFCKTGFKSDKIEGSPELPYFGLLIHLPECIEFAAPVQEKMDDILDLNDLPIYPAQDNVQDNVNYLKNYQINAQYNEELYGALPKLNGVIGISTNHQIEFNDSGEAIATESTDNNFAWTGKPYYIGASRYFLLELFPLIFNETSLSLRSNIKIYIRNIRLKPVLPTDHYLDTPYLPGEFDRLPKHERIIDPWNNIADFQKIIPNSKPYNVEDYEEFGPELIIFYLKNSKQKKIQNLSAAAAQLASHKKNFGYENVRTFPVEGKKAFDDKEKIKTEIIKAIGQLHSSSRDSKFSIPRLNSIILLGDIPLIGGMDLYNEIYTESTDSFVNRSEVEQYLSDYCVSSALNRIEDVKYRWPNFAIGRIPVKTYEEANVVIDNIIAYETKEYQKEIYKNLTLVSYFQDRGPGSQVMDHIASKDYLQCVEEIRLNIDKASVEMIYLTENPDKTVSKHKYRDETDLDGAIRFLDIEEAKNMTKNVFRKGGRFLVHRDHGWMNGWAHPNFKVPDLWGVQCTSDYPTIVFNINCLSGRFTGDEEAGLPKYKLPVKENDCFSEALLKGTVLPNGNRLDFKIPAVITASEVSPSFENDWLLKIMFDEIYGGILTDKPKKNSEMGKQRIGDVFNIAKILLYAYQGDRDMHVHDNVVFNILGDPTLLV